MIGIISPMKEEREPILDFFKTNQKEPIFIQGVEIYFGEIENTSCILALSGIGKISAANCASVLTNRFSLEAIINLGSSGATYDKLELGDIVISKGFVEIDGGNSKEVIPADERLISICNKTSAYLETIEEGKKLSFYNGIVATLDQFRNDPEFKKALYIDCNAYCDEMEGVAIARVCSHNNIPFVAIRAISDKPSHKQELQFNDNLKGASEICAFYLKNFIKFYEKENSFIGVVTTIEELKDIINFTEKIILKNKEFYISKGDTTNYVYKIVTEGKVNISMATRDLLDNFNVLGIVYLGFSYEHKKDIAIKDVVFSGEFVQGDFDLTELNINRDFKDKLLLGQLYERKEQYIKSIPLKIIEDKLNKEGYFKGRVCSSDKKMNNIEEIDADFLDKGSAAAALVCFYSSVPCIVIDLVSKSKGTIKYIVENILV